MHKRRALTTEEQGDASRLRDLVRNDPRSQSAIAEACGWNSQGTVSQYTLGKIPLNFEAAARFAKTLGVDIAEISPRLAASRYVPAENDNVLQLVKSLGRAVRSAREHANIDPATAAQDAEIDISTFFGIESGEWSWDFLPDEDPIRHSETIQRVAKAIGTTPQQLASAMDSHSFRLVVEDQATPPEQTDLLQNKFDDTYSTLNRVRGAALAGGGGAYAWEFEEVDHSHAFRREWLDEKGLRPHRCKLWGVTGDSMAPWACDGDVVMINMDQTQIRNGKVYAIAAGDELRIKRLFKRSDGSIEVRSDNPSPMYPTETYYGEDINNIKIIGEVVWRGG